MKKQEKKRQSADKKAATPLTSGEKQSYCRTRFTMRLYVNHPSPVMNI